jgi:hypothetical protein
VLQKYEPKQSGVDRGGLKILKKEGTYLYAQVKCTRRSTKDISSTMVL